MRSYVEHKGGPQNSGPGPAPIELSQGELVNFLEPPFLHPRNGVKASFHLLHSSVGKLQPYDTDKGLCK